MADEGLRKAFDDCLNRMASGQSIEDCLRQHPQYAADLRPMLEVGSLVERMQVSTYEVSSAKERVRIRVSEHVPSRRAKPTYSRFATLVASLIIVLAVLVGAAENSLPGDPLYSVKRFTENARSSLTGQQFSARRLDEIRALETLRRTVNVEFSGQVEEIDGTKWRVSGLEMRVGSDTVSAASVVTGDTIQVSGRVTAQGDVVASAITLINKAVVPLTSTLTPTVTSSATPTTTNTPTPSPTIRPALTPTASPTTCAPSKPSGWVRYVVQANDTVSELGFYTGASPEELVAVNCLSDTLMIYVGQTLFLPMFPPATQTHTQPELTISPQIPVSTQPAEADPPPAAGEPTATDISHENEDDGHED